MSASNHDLAIVKGLVLAGWPKDIGDCPPEGCVYWTSREDLTVVDGVLFKDPEIHAKRDVSKDI